MTIKELKEQRAAAKVGAGEILTVAKGESRQVTAEEQTQFRALMAEFDSLTQEISNLETLAAADATLEAVDKRKVPGEITTPQKVEYKGLRCAKLNAFKGPDAERNAYRSGKWMQSVVYGDKEAGEWCRTHSVEQRVQIEGVNVKGGAVVPTEMSTAIIDLREAYGMARQECRIVSMSSDTMTIPRRTGGITAYFVGETAATTAKDKSWDNIQLTAKELSCETRLSKSLAEDAIINMVDDLAREQAYSFAAKEDACLLDGDGTTTYGGMVGIRTKMVDGNHAGSYVDATANDDQFTELLLPDIISTSVPSPQYASANAAWYFSKYGWNSSVVRLVQALTGNTTQTVAQGMVLQLNGDPVKLYSAMPAASTAYNLVVMFLYGDISLAATLGDRRGITVETDPYSLSSYRQIKVISTERLDIVVHDIGDATTTGPVVGFRGVT